MSRQYRCIICGKRNTEVKMLIGLKEDDSLYICDDCCESLYETKIDYMRLHPDEFDEDEIDRLENMTGSKPTGKMKKKSSTRAQLAKDLKLIPPAEIHKYLDDYIIGQEDAKKIISVAIYNHMKRIKFDKDDKIKKSNILMVGPTGSGKTHIARTIAKFLGVPFTVADVTSLTEAGYVGDDVENILLQLIQAADGDIEKAEMGIVFLDEIDKIARKGENVSITRDVSGEGVQQALLKMVEGAEIRVPVGGGRKHPNADCYTINTENILFIASGAFDGLENIVKLSEDKPMGFMSTGKPNEKKQGKITIDDLKKFGIIPEFLGRFPILAQLNELSKDELVRILTEPKDNVVSQYKTLMEYDEVALDFEDAALNEIANMAIKNKTGARGLKTIIEDSMLDIMYDVPSDDKIGRVIITPNVVTKHEKPKIEYRGRRRA